MSANPVSNASPSGANDPTVAGQIPQPPRRGFALTRWFGGVAMVAISVIAASSVWMLSWFLTERLLWQEAALTRDFVQSLVIVEKPLQAYFSDPTTAPPQVEDSFEHFARMPEVLRANVYDRQRNVLWSSDPALIGRRFGPNEELDHALTGAVVVEKKTVEERIHGKDEYVSLHQTSDLFVEIYVPVFDVDSGQVVGAIEFYKNPRGLMQILAQLRSYIALGAAGFGLLLFAALFGLVRRADGLIEAQHRRLVEAETYAVIGEMSSVVAHAIRNPLAAMRSSAELILDGIRSGRREGSGQQALRDAGNAEAAQDILVQADRLGSWLRELLSYTRPSEARPQAVSVAPLVHSCLQEMSRELERRRVGAVATALEALPAVQADSLVVGQVLRSVLANALEAVPDGGRIAVNGSLGADGQQLTLTVSDNGPGMTAAQRAGVGTPFFTTKPQGMGVGLALARRVLERSGGFLRIDSEPGRGTVVSIGLRTMPGGANPEART